MRQNVGTTERLVRGLGAAGVITCAFMAPLAAEVRLPLFGVVGGYLLYSALSGTCLGYRLVGKNTCATGPT